MKPLKLFNGRWRPGDLRSCTAYACGHSGAHVMRLAKAAGYDLSAAELSTYWNKGCWGRTMDGIAPEVGIWLSHRYAKPIRVVGADGNAIAD